LVIARAAKLAGRALMRFGRANMDAGGALVRIGHPRARIADLHQRPRIPGPLAAQTAHRERLGRRTERDQSEF
jgi:hypothetical protein